MLTGHLAENELRGGLTFIERALGIEKARTFYEEEGLQALSQSELARRLAADGYPVPQLKTQMPVLSAAKKGGTMIRVKAISHIGI